MRIDVYVSTDVKSIRHFLHQMGEGEKWVIFKNYAKMTEIWVESIVLGAADINILIPDSIMRIEMWRGQLQNLQNDRDWCRFHLSWLVTVRTLFKYNISPCPIIIIFIARKIRIVVISHLNLFGFHVNWSLISLLLMAPRG